LVADITNPDNNIDVGNDNEKTVLIVDNQPRETAALQKRLAFAGFKTEIATTGAGAIKIVEEHPPDIVLLEASLSDIDSVEVVAFIRSDVRTCRLPVLAMSALGHMKGRCLEGGCDDFLQKPIKILDLVARIRRALLAAGQPEGADQGWQALVCGEVHLAFEPVI
jgi:DNA-binding response OmpR family regulator